MRTPLFQVDAFTSRLYAGNPAAVMPLPSFLPEATLQSVAAENNLSETAFIVGKDGHYQLRWFTPTVEVPLCGHATLASAAVVMERLEPGRTSVLFESASGPLQVDRTQSCYVMDFPSRPFEPVANPSALPEALGVAAIEVYVNSFNYLVLVKSASVLRTLAPDMAAVARIDRSGLIVTSPGVDSYDFLSRYFAPGKGIPEDPVTGSAHCMLAPYWAKKLGKSTLRAYQASARGGEIICRLEGNRVKLQGQCVFYLEGTAEI